MTTGLLAFDADQHLGAIAPLAIKRGVRIFLPYYKLFTYADRDAIFAAAKAAGVEVGIIPIFELTAERALQGASAGAEDAASIVRTMTLVQQPPATAFILTFDFDEQAAQDPASKAYASAVVAGVPGHPMIAYGNGALAEELKAAGLAKFAWDAGGSGMRGTRVDLAAGKEDMEQDVGDVRGLHLGISIDSDFAPHATSPADLDAWCSPSADGAGTTTAAIPSSVVPVAIPSAKQLQEALVAAGEDVGPTGADGIWGDASAAALVSYFRRG